MKSFILVLVIVQAVQNTHGQCIRTSSCLAPPVAVPTLPVTSSVANTLADTLSLLTVSSLLAETLPFAPNVIATVPVCQSTPTVISGCGCGLTTPVINGCGCGLTTPTVINGCGCGLTTPMINGCGCGLTTPTVISSGGCGLGGLRYGFGDCGCSIGCSPGCGSGYGCNYWY